MEVKHDLILRLVKILNPILMGIPVVFFWIINISGKFNFSELPYKEGCLVVFLFLVLYFLFGKIYDAFWISFNRLPEMIYSQILAAVLSELRLGTLMHFRHRKRQLFITHMMNCSLLSRITD